MIREQIEGRKSRHRLRRCAVLAVASVVALSLTACGATSGGSGNGNGETTDTLTLANAVKIDNIDPGASPPANETIWLDQMLWSRLVLPSEDTTSIQPGLAKSWDISKDKLTYTFHLRPAKFSDGSPLTAEDVAYSINRSKNNPEAWGFLITAVKSITAPDKDTVVVKLSEPHAPLLADLAIYAFAVVPEKLVKAAGSDSTGKNPGKYFTTAPIVTSGPYYVSSYSPDSEVTLKANKYFWGKKPAISTFNVKVIPNDNDRVLALQSGNVDVIENPPVSQRDNIDSNPKLAVDYFNSTRVDSLYLNNKNKYLSNLKVRQAIRYALDLKTMNKLAYNGKAAIASSFMPYKMQYWNDSLGPWPHDVAKAKQLLAEAGYPNGFPLQLITVSGDTINTAEGVAIQSALKKIGIKVNIASYELLTAYDKEDQPDFEMGLRYWTNDIIDPDEVVGLDADPTSPSKLVSWSIPGLHDLAVQAREELDPQKRAELYDQIQKKMYDQSPYIPMLYPPFSYARGTWVHGFEVSPLGTYRDSVLNSVKVDQH
ncbi:MAG TPA: ABC transporter substrate-binding protein [Nocardioidaceae bacterium]|nr:ABC transporter substrate-binding protein [Nocardioidaceae bacterium]